MSTKKTSHKLADMTNLISASLEENGTKNVETDYAYSASFASPRSRHIEGQWAVLEHIVDGRPYEEVFASSTFKDMEHGDLTYDATYEFTSALCIKRVRICVEIMADGKTAAYEYRMNMVLTWETGNGRISVRPVLGYQYSSLGGKPLAVHELPPSNSRIDISVKFENGFMILEDGTDVKKLGRIEA